jgi:hypothetical protein
MSGPLTEEMRVKKFRSDEEVQQVVHEWLGRQPQESFIEESICFVNAEGPVLNEMETM